MLDINVEPYTRIEDEDVVVIAHAWGLYGAEHEHDHVKIESCYSYQFNLEELISSVSVEAAVEFFKQYGERCYISTIHIMNEDAYEAYLKEQGRTDDCRFPDYLED